MSDYPFPLRCAIAAFIIIAVIALRWVITIGVIYLIFLCFGLKYDLLTATGIWLVLCLLENYISASMRK